MANRTSAQTLKVKDIVAALLAQDQEAEMGIHASYAGGWIEGIGGLKKTAEGIICIETADRHDGALLDEEVGLYRLNDDLDAEV